MPEELITFIQLDNQHTTRIQHDIYRLVSLSKWSCLFHFERELRTFVCIIKDCDRKHMNAIALLITSIDEPIDKMNGEIRSVSRYYYKFVNIQ